MFGRKSSRSLVVNPPAAPVAHAIEPAPADPAHQEAADASVASDGFYFPPAREMLIGEGVTLTGEVRNCTRLVIAGSFSGTLFASEVIVLSKASLSAVVVADRVDIFGHVTGEIVAAELVRFRESAVFDGRLVYGQMVVEPGAELTGELSQVASEDEQRALEELASYAGSPEGPMPATGLTADTVYPPRDYDRSGTPASPG